ncbi:transcription antitermination NusB family protein [Enterococcus avium]|uniref:hypothetical protein n=1 Tax=Enterococcus avium TaxID=33945 RepID=UPI003833D485
MTSVFKDSRRDLRERAFQTLFSLETGGEFIEAAHFAYGYDKTVSEDKVLEVPIFLLNLVNGVVDNKDLLDTLISCHLKSGWILVRVHISIFPKNINIAYLTRSHLILEHFYLFILLSIFSLVLAICILNLRNKALDLSKYKSSFLKYNNQKRKSPFIVILSIIFSNSLFFIKFIEFQPSLNGKNYYIGEN